MNPRPPKGTLPKGPQPVISFRISTEAQKLINEIRALEPHAEPGLIPHTLGSDSEFVRWVFLENATKLKNRLVAQIKLKDLIIKDKNLSEQQDYVLRLEEEGKINLQARIDAMEDLQEQRNSNYDEIEKICTENLIPPPKGYAWSENKNPFEYHEVQRSEYNELVSAAWDFKNYLLEPKHREYLSTKKKAEILKFAENAGWALNSIEDERKILLDLLTGTHPVTDLISIYYSEMANGKSRFRNDIQNRLKDLETT